MLCKVGIFFSCFLFPQVDKLISLFSAGAISYTEYLFLLCILTSEYLWLPSSILKRSGGCLVISFYIPEPHAGFRIAFNMFDADGNEMVDKREFMVVWCPPPPC